MAEALQAESLKADLIKYSHRLYQRGLIHASGGNTSVRLGRQVWITHTGATLGELSLQDLVVVNMDGSILEGGIPSKELGMHLALYRARPDVGAVIHVHPAHCIAYSALQSGPSLDAIPPYTAGFYLRAGRVPMVGYHLSGSASLHHAIKELTPQYHVILLQNHGLVVAGPDMLTAFNITEEVEENCKIALIAGDQASCLTAQQCAEIDSKLGRRWE